MAKMGRPAYEIDKEQFEKLCGIQATKAEICAWFRVSDSTVERWVHKNYGEPFEDIRRKKSEIGKVGLRRAMFQKALDGNVPLLIWLSKQYLGMSEKVETTIGPAEVKKEIVYQAEWGSVAEPKQLTESSGEKVGSE